MAYMCQQCSHEGEDWAGQCPQCGGKQYLTLAPKKKDLIGETIDNTFKVVGKLGQGGMGTVYRAERVGIGQIVAIKVLNPEFSNEPEVVRRFLREAKSYGMVQHPNAVNLLGFGQLPDSALYIAMEFISGKDASKTIQERGRLSIQEAIDVVVQCCDVLGYAHDKGVIHRDLKPENIMLVKGYRGYSAKVLDFGIARLVSDTATQLTVAGTICGTPRYMSPEQARGKEIDARSDIYSLGLVAFELFTGRQAFTYGSITELLRAQVTEPIPHLHEVQGITGMPEALDMVIQRACDKDREKRYVSMGEFADALSKAIPTMTDIAAYSASSVGLPSSDPAAPGRTFLGPGAGGSPSLGSASAANVAPGLSQASIPGSHGVAGNVSEATYMPGSLPNLPAQQLDGSPQATFIKPPSRSNLPAVKAAQGAGGASMPSVVASPSLSGVTVGEDRPDAPRASGGNTGLLLGVGAIALVAIGVVVGPKLMGGDKPAIDPIAIQPIAQPIQPVAQPTQPVAQHTQPVAQPTQPVAQPTQPVAQPTQPVAQPTQPVAQPTQPVAQPTQPVAIVAQPTTGGRPPRNGTGGKSPSTTPEPVVTAPVRTSGGEGSAVTGYVAQAQQMLIKGELVAAKRMVEEAEKLSPSSGEVGRVRDGVRRAQELLDRAQSAFRSGDCPTAVGLFRQARELSPASSEVKEGIAKCDKSAAPTTLE